MASPTCVPVVSPLPGGDSSLLFFSILGLGPELGGLVRHMQGHRSEVSRRLLSAIPFRASPSQDCSEDCLDNREVLRK